jgi:hypothetical protein
MFKIAATLNAIANMLLAAVWYFAPERILDVWGIGSPSPANMLERRLGAMVFFLGVLMLAARNAQPSPARSAISYAAICMGLTLAATSVYEYWMGSATAGVLPGVGFNLAFALWFALIEWFERQEKHKTLQE